MAGRTGHKCKLYYNAGTVTSPTWTEIDEVGDVSVPDLALKLAELQRRASDHAKNLPNVFSPFAAEFRLHEGLNTTVYNALVSFFFAQEIKEFAVMNGNITVTGNYGLRCPMIIERFPWGQGIEEISGHDVRIAEAYYEEPADTEIDPEWYTVT